MKRIVPLAIFLHMLIFASEPAGAATKELRILAASRIVPQSVALGFEAKYGIKVRFEYLESADALAAYLETRPNEDLALVRDHSLDDLRAKHQAAELDHSLLSNLQYMDPAYLEALPDAGSRYYIPYLVGNVGLMYRNDILGRSPPNLNQLFDPDFAVMPFSIMNQYRDALGIALKYLGYSCNSTNITQIEDAATLLKSLRDRPSFIGFLNRGSARRFLKEEITYLAVSYNNEAAKAVEEDSRMAYVTVDDALVGWFFAHIINAESENIAEAHLWLNYLMEPEVAAEISIWNMATSPNLAARDLMPEHIRNNPVLYPEGGVWRRAEIPVSIGDADKTYIEFWQRL